jgi:hypothetical protein
LPREQTSVSKPSAIFKVLSTPLLGHSPPEATLGTHTTVILTSLTLCLLEATTEVVGYGAILYNLTLPLELTQQLSHPFTTIPAAA